VRCVYVWEVRGVQGKIRGGEREGLECRGLRCSRNLEGGRGRADDGGE